jgi:hypothetical protein
MNTLPIKSISYSFLFRLLKISLSIFANQINEWVPNVKPYPFPDLEGKAAEDFERQIKKPLTAVQKRMLKEGALVFAQTKKHK